MNTVGDFIEKNFVDSNPRRYGGLVTLKSEQRVDTNGVTDGYHTFGELYEHRFELWMLTCRMFRILKLGPVWKSSQHHDGSFYPGWFLLGYGIGEWQITYHLPSRLWDRCSFAEVVIKAPYFDGHTPQDVLKRLPQTINHIITPSGFDPSVETFESDAFETAEKPQEERPGGPFDDYGMAIGPDGDLYRTMPGEMLGYPGWTVISRKSKVFFREDGRLLRRFWSTKRACDYAGMLMDEKLDLSIEDCDNILFCIDYRREDTYEPNHRLKLTMLETKILAYKISLGMKGTAVENSDLVKMDLRSVPGMRIHKVAGYDPSRLTIHKDPQGNDLVPKVNQPNLAEEDKIAQGMMGNFATSHPVSPEAAEMIKADVEAHEDGKYHIDGNAEIARFEEWKILNKWRVRCPDKGLGDRLFILLWARYVAWRCGATGFGYGEGVSASRTHPFRFKDMRHETRFYTIVGSHNLDEICKLFY